MKLNLLTLKFSGESATLEESFVKDYRKKSLFHIRISLLLAALMYAAFGILDAFIMPEQKATAWLIRYIIVCPALLGTLLTSFSKVFERYMQLLIVCDLLLAGGGIVCMIIIAPAPVGYYYYAGLVLVFIWGYTFSRVRFLWASLAGWLQVALYEIAAIWITPTPFLVLISNNFFFISANVIGMMACYSIEFYTRRDFFLTQEIAMEREKVDRINKELEERVEKRMEDYRILNLALEQEIKERKRAEEVLQESEERYRNLFENANESIFVAQNGMLVFINQMTTTMLGYSDEELATKPFIEFIHPDDRGMVIDRHVRRMKGETIPALYPFRIIYRNGSIRWIELNAVLINWKGKPATLNFMSDITDRKQAEEALQKSEAMYRLLAENASDTIWMVRLDGTFTYHSPAVKQLRGYTPEEANLIPIEHTVTPASMSIIQSIVEEENSKPNAKRWADRIVELEMYRKDGVTIWTEASLRAVRDFEGNVIGLQGSTRDITDRKLAEEELHQTLDHLRKAFGSIIQVMVSAIESRDPYTAGHQLRVAHLARAIVTEMGLGKDKINGIRMAGSIHDIGKLSIPAEILSKPTKLSEIEIPLIRQHVQKGYEMLKDVTLPWPLADIVLQHHERMDGSGYPRGLKGGEILMEACILAVADVVEAMASHRPYRPALGLNAALAEIESNKGKLYNAEAVDACLRLFREKGFQLEGA